MIARKCRAMIVFGPKTLQQAYADGEVSEDMLFGMMPVMYFESTAIYLDPDGILRVRKRLR